MPFLLKSTGKEMTAIANVLCFAILGKNLYTFHSITFTQWLKIVKVKCEPQEHTCKGLQGIKHGLY